MPTGLTCNIYDGSDTSLRGFALKCVTQLGAGYHATRQGEEKMPLDKAPVMQVSDYYLERINEAKRDLEKWNKLKDNPEELDRLYKEYLDERKKEKDEYTINKYNIKKRYLAMKSKIESWNLPETYNSLKELMLKQINDSIDFDCGKDYLIDYPTISKEDWLESNLSSPSTDIEYYTKRYEEEVKRTKEINDYLKGLYEELDKVDPL